MSDVLRQRAEDITITGADLQAGQVMLTPPICTMGARAHVTQYNVFATLGNGVNRRFLVIVTVASAGLANTVHPATLSGLSCLLRLW